MDKIRQKKIRQKKIIYIIALIIYAIYTLFIYNETSYGILNMILFLVYIFSGFYLAEDVSIYQDKSKANKIKWATLIIGLGLAILAVIIEYPADQAKDMITESIARGFIIAFVVWGVSKLRLAWGLIDK